MKKYPLHKTCIATHIRGDASSRYFVIDMRISPEDIKGGDIVLFDEQEWYVSDVVWMNGGYVLIVSVFMRNKEWDVERCIHWSTWNFDRI